MVVVVVMSLLWLDASTAAASGSSSASTTNNASVTVPAGTNRSATATWSTTSTTSTTAAWVQTSQARYSWRATLPICPLGSINSDGDLLGAMGGFGGLAAPHGWASANGSQLCFPWRTTAAGAAACPTTPVAGCLSESWDYQSYGGFDTANPDINRASTGAPNDYQEWFLLNTNPPWPNGYFPALGGFNTCFITNNTAWAFNGFYIRYDPTSSYCGAGTAGPGEPDYRNVKEFLGFNRAEQYPNHYCDENMRWHGFFGYSTGFWMQCVRTSTWRTTHEYQVSTTTTTTHRVTLSCRASGDGPGVTRNSRSFIVAAPAGTFSLSVSADNSTATLTSGSFSTSASMAELCRSSGPLRPT